jgi:hypothetical protein
MGQSSYPEWRLELQQLANDARLELEVMRSELFFEEEAAMFMLMAH